MDTNTILFFWFMTTCSALTSKELHTNNLTLWIPHFAVIDLIVDNDEILSREQELLDNHDDLVSSSHQPIAIFHVY